MLKKIFSVFLAVLIFSGLLMTVDAQQEVTYNVNLLQNSDFETVKNGVAENWNGFGNWNNGSTISLVTGDSCPIDNGNNCAKIDVSANNDNPYIWQTASVPYGGCKYSISLWIKGVTTQAMSVKISESDKNGKILLEHYSTGFHATDDWRCVEFQFYAQKEATSISVMPRGYAEGTVIYVDYVRIIALEGPVQFDMQTDWVFYYEEFDKSEVTFTMNEFYNDPGYRVDFEIKRGPVTYDQSKGNRLVDGKIEEVLDISRLPKKAECNLNAIIYDEKGEYYKTITRPIYRIDRPTALTKDGVYMVDGEPFEPVFAYHFDMNDAADAVKAGVNVIQWAPSNGLDRDITFAELDAIHAAGLKAAVVCYWGMRPAGHPQNADRIATFVDMIKDHPAVFCYMIMDEPFGHDPNAEPDLFNSYKIIRMRDDKHPVYCCESVPAKYRTTAKYVDILCADIYPGKGDFSTTVADIALRTKAGTEGIKPMYVLVQSMSWGGIIPDGAMLRTQLFQAMMAGAQAVGYYPWMPDNPEVDVDLNESRYWDTMVSFHNIDQPLLYSYYGRNEHEQYNVYHGDGYWYESWVADGGIYYALISRSQNESAATLSLAGNNGEKLIKNYNVEIINGDSQPEITRNSNNFTVKMDGYHAAIYKVVPGAESVELVENGDFEQGDAESITGWTNVNTAQAVIADNDGNNTLDLPTQAMMRQVVPITSWESQGKNHGYIFSVYLGYTKGGFPAFSITAGFEDGTSIKQEVSVVRSKEDVTDPTCQIYAPLWQWTKLEYDISRLTQSSTSRLVSVMIDLMGKGAGCHFDNVSLIPYSAEGETPEILFFNGYDEITSIEDTGDNITARAYNIAVGDRLYLALYTESYGEERLCRICTDRAELINSISCTLNKGSDNITKIRAFLWTENMGIKALNILE